MSDPNKKSTITGRIISETTDSKALIPDEQNNEARAAQGLNKWRESAADAADTGSYRSVSPSPPVVDRSYDKASTPPTLTGVAYLSCLEGEDLGNPESRFVEGREVTDFGSILSESCNSAGIGILDIKHITAHDAKRNPVTSAKQQRSGPARREDAYLASIRGMWTNRMDLQHRRAVPSQCRFKPTGGKGLKICVVDTHSTGHQAAAGDVGTTCDETTRRALDNAHKPHNTDAVLTPSKAGLTYPLKEKKRPTPHFNDSATPKKVLVPPPDPQFENVTHRQQQSSAPKSSSGRIDPHPDLHQEHRDGAASVTEDVVMLPGAGNDDYKQTSQQPGAFATPPRTSLHNGRSERIIPSSHEAEAYVSAKFVDEEEVIIARKEGAISVNFKNRRVKLCVALCFVVSFGGIISGVLVATRPSSSIHPFSTKQAQKWVSLPSPILGQKRYSSFGASVTLSSNGSSLVIGDDGACVAMVFKRDTDDIKADWQQWGETLLNPGDSWFSGTRFGSSTAMSSDGHIIAAGCPGCLNNSVGAKPDGLSYMESSGVNRTYYAVGPKGTVRVYKWDGAAWMPFAGNVFLEGYDAYDDYGSSIALSGDGSILAVGAPGAFSGQGCVNVYKSGSISGNATSDDAGEILETAVFQGAEKTEWGDGFGCSVAISRDGSTIAAASYEYVFIYRSEGFSWTQLGSPISFTEDNGTYSWSQCLDSALSQDGNILAFGLHGEDIVKIFQWNGTSWIQKGNSIRGACPGVASMTGTGSDFGASVAISDDGSVVASTGSVPCEDSSAFEWNGTDWAQRGDKISWTNAVLGDMGRFVLDFYLNVALSADGKTFAIGDPHYTHRGRVEVFRWL